MGQRVGQNTDQFVRTGEILCSSIECYRFTTDIPQFPVSFHWHYFAEVIRVRSGSLKVCRGEKEYALSAGDALFITPLISHSLDYSSPGEHAEYDVIRLDLELFGDLPSSYTPDLRAMILEAEKRGCSMMVSAPDMHIPHMDLAIDACMEEYRKREYGYDLRIRALLYLLYTSLIQRWISAGFTPQNYSSRIDPIYTLPNYIARHIQDPLKVEELAQLCGLSYPWFARKFREIYGISCKEYIERVRIRRVEHYLQFTDCDLDYISSHTGYADCSHLVRDFRKLRNTTPGQFRKAVRKKPQGLGEFPQNY